MAEPLDKNDLALLNDATKMLDAAKEQVQRSKQAGIDTGTQEERIRILGDRVLALKRSFFPTGRAAK